MDVTRPASQQPHRSDSPIPYGSDRARDRSTIDAESLEYLRCVLDKVPNQFSLYKRDAFQALAPLLVNCKRQSDSTFLLRFEPRNGFSSNDGAQHYTIASLMREWATRKAPETRMQPRSSRLAEFDEDDFEILTRSFFCGCVEKKKALADTGSAEDVSASIRPNEHGQDDENEGMVQSAGLTTALHSATSPPTLQQWQVQQEQQECVMEATEPSLAKDLVAKIHTQAASKEPECFTFSARNTAELSAILPNASPASTPSEHRNIQMSVNTSTGTPPAAVKDVNENAQTHHGFRKRAKRSEPLEQGLSRVLAVVGRELDQEHGRLAAPYKSAERSFEAAKDEQQHYEAALSSINPLLIQTLDEVKAAAKTSEHKCKVADAQAELDEISAQLKRQLTAFKDAVVEGVQEEFADRVSHLMDML
ncbi:hypothetical protein WJX82_008334 [Trebouxia sp. C0006]